MSDTEFLWVEKYRPHKIDDCILPEGLKKTFKQFLKTGQLSNMILSGPPGTGKTTVARALCEEMGCDYIVVNSSLESGIDTLRTRIAQFCSTVSMAGGHKVVILDEFDYSNANSFQPAFRAFLEEFSDNVRFIMTCNYKNKIIEPIHSRCAVYEFQIAKADAPKMAGLFFERMKTILKEENVEFNDGVLAQVVKRFFPDYRRTLNELQRYAVSGAVDEGILSHIRDINIKDLMKSMKEKDFKGMRKWVVDNLDSDTVAVLRNIYDNMYDYVSPQSIPNLVLLLADYQYKSAFVSDHELNLVACLTEAMATVEFK